MKRLASGVKSGGPLALGVLHDSPNDEAPGLLNPVKRLIRWVVAPSPEAAARETEAMDALAHLDLSPEMVSASTHSASGPRA